MSFRPVIPADVMRITVGTWAIEIVCAALLILSLACVGTQSQSDEGSNSTAERAMSNVGLEATEPVDSGPTAAPNPTLTGTELATRTARIAGFERARPVLEAFREADPGFWRLDYNHRRPEDFPTVSVGADRTTTMMVSCAPAEELQVSFVRRKAFMSETDIRLTFVSGDGTDIRLLQLYNNRPEWYERPTFDSANSGTVVNHMLANSQAIVDGMLLDGASELRARFETRKKKPISGYPDVNDHDFEIAGFPVVHEILTGYCRLTPAEIQATTAAEGLTAPTPTPIPTLTLTPTPLVTWQQEWCEEQDNPRIGIEGYWHPLSTVDGTSRLVIRCTGSILVVGIHITRSDGVYPENESGVAYTVQQGGEVGPYRHHEDGWQQVQGSRDEGMFIILPDAVAKDVVEIAFGPQFKDIRDLSLWVLFDAVSGSDQEQYPRMHDHDLGTDVVIPLRRLAVIHPLEGE